MGKIIENYILSYFIRNYRGLVPHPTLITKLCILGGVEGDWEEEETCSRASPLTLTRITKGPKNKGKEKEVEIEEEERDDKGNKQAHLESIVQERQERQSCSLLSLVNGMDWYGNQINRFIRLGLQERQFG